MQEFDYADGQSSDSLLKMHAKSNKREDIKKEKPKMGP